MTFPPSHLTVPSTVVIAIVAYYLWSCFLSHYPNKLTKVISFELNVKRKRNPTNVFEPLVMSSFSSSLHFHLNETL